MVIALMIKPGEHPSITMLCDTAEYLNHAVSQDSDEICFAQARRLENGLAILHADSCASFGFSANRKVNGKLISGTFYIVGVAAGKLRSLTDREISKYTAQFWQAESYTEDEVLEAWLDEIAEL